jgi:Arc/MetJ-type ribon-helix-helix transcriptional regulator
VGDKRGQSINKESKVYMETKDYQIKFRLTGDMKAAIEALANRKDVSASWIIREALKEYIQKEKKNESNK